MDDPRGEPRTVVSATPSDHPSTIVTEGRGVSAGGILGYGSAGIIPPGGQAFLNSLIRMQLLTEGAVQEFLQRTQPIHEQFDNADIVGKALVDAGYVTKYQLERVVSGKTWGLVLANYRLLDEICPGEHRQVYLAEHIYLRRRAAIKVLLTDDTCTPNQLERFYAEMQVLAALVHPHIVQAFDAGRLAPPHATMPGLVYLAMEHMQGGDLHRYVARQGPVPVAQACEWARQAASALQMSHDHHLIHRDVKPSNLLLTQDKKVKLVDFGLARQFSSQLTAPKALLGTVEFMAPEQARDASEVSTRVDIYGLGATLFFLLTGQTPYPPTRRMREKLKMLQETRPRRLSSLMPDAPADLDSLLDRMLDPDPTRRPALPLTVINSLLPFVGRGGG